MAAQTQSSQEDALERAAPRQLDEYVGQHKARGQLEIFIEAVKNAAKRWTMCCCLARPAWAKPRWRTSSPVNWG